MKANGKTPTWVQLRRPSTGMYVKINLRSGKILDKKTDGPFAHIRKATSDAPKLREQYGIA